MYLQNYIDIMQGQSQTYFVHMMKMLKIWLQLKFLEYEEAANAY